MEFRTCRSEDRLSAIELSKSIFKENMAEQFLCLFGKENLDHMFLAVDEGKIVSMVNYYPATVLIHGALIRVGSVGSVCTNPAYRGQKIASRLLSMAGDKMTQEGISVMIISGQGGLYSSYGADFAGTATEWFVPKGIFSAPSSVRIAEFHEADLPTMIKVYETEPVRFLRSPDEFRRLLQGQTYPDIHHRYPIELILNGGKVAAYAILDLSDQDQDDTIGIKEFAGDRQVLVNAFDLLLAKYGRQRMHFATDPHDALEKSLSGSENRPIHQFSSLKILDFVGFMDALKPYWEPLIPEMASAFRYEEFLGSYRFLWGTETLNVPDIVSLTRLILGYPEPLTLDFSGCNGLHLILTRLFPIPFAWTHNLNYQ